MVYQDFRRATCTLLSYKFLLRIVTPEIFTSLKGSNLQSDNIKPVWKIYKLQFTKCPVGVGCRNTEELHVFIITKIRSFQQNIKMLKTQIWSITGLWVPHFSISIRWGWVGAFQCFNCAYKRVWLSRLTGVHLVVVGKEFESSWTHPNSNKFWIMFNTFHMENVENF